MAETRGCFAQPWGWGSPWRLSLCCHQKLQCSKVPDLRVCEMLLAGVAQLQEVVLPLTPFGTCIISDEPQGQSLAGGHQGLLRSELELCLVLCAGV